MSVSDLPTGFLWAMAGLVGLCVGSFLNVVIYRTPKMMELTEADEPLTLSYPSSQCPACHTPLRIVDLVPVLSWVFLKGQCAHCNAGISARYPAIEMLNAAVWVICAMHWNHLGTALAWATFCSISIALAMIDWDTTLLPDALTLPLIWLGLIASTAGLIEVSANEAILGATAGYLFLWLVATGFELVTGKIGMGGGDLKLLAAIGAWLGPLGCIAVVVLASVSGALVGVVLHKMQRLRPGGYLPFGPFLSGSAIVLAFQPAMTSIADVTVLNLF